MNQFIVDGPINKNPRRVWFLLRHAGVLWGQEPVVAAVRLLQTWDWLTLEIIWQHWRNGACGGQITSRELILPSLHHFMTALIISCWINVGSNSNIQQQLGYTEQGTENFSFNLKALRLCSLLLGCLFVNLCLEDGRGHQAGVGVHMTGLLRGKNKIGWV